MRKHFLILMLLALLPMAGWAGVLTFKVGGAAIPAEGLSYTGGDYLTATANTLTVYSGETDVTDEDGLVWTYSATDPTVDAGTEVHAVLKAGYYKAEKGSDSGIIQIKKLDITMSQLPVLNAAVTYDGEAHQAIKIAGSPSNASGVGSLTIYYAVSKTGMPSAEPLSAWSTSIDDAKLKVTEAGDYGVYYMVKSDNTDNLNNIEPTALTTNFTVKKAITTLATAPVAVTGLTYTKLGQNLVTAGTSADGTLQYRLNNEGDWSNDIPQGTDAGNYKVYYRVYPTDATNYDAYQPHHFESSAPTIPVYEFVSVSIAKRQVNIKPRAINTFFGDVKVDDLTKIVVDVTGLQEDDATDYEGDGKIFDSGNDAKKLVKSFASVPDSKKTAITETGLTYYNAGTYTDALQVTSSAENNNYIFIYQNSDMTINPAKLTVQLETAPAPAIYGTAEAAKTSWGLTWAEKAKLTVKYQNGESSYATVSNNANFKEYLKLTNLNANGTPKDASIFDGLTISRANTSSAVGTYALTLSGATPVSDNFVIAENGQTVKDGETFKITAAEITITAVNAQKTYGAEEPAAFNYTVKNTGSTSTYVLSPAQKAVVDAAITRAEGETAGNYEITINNDVRNSAVFAGYTVTLKNGWFTINKRDLVITANPQTLYIGDKQSEKLGKAENVNWTIEGIQTVNGVKDAYNSVSLEFSTATPEVPVTGSGANIALGATAATSGYSGTAAPGTPGVWVNGIKITMSAAQTTALSANYNIILKHGTLTVLNAANGIVLNGTLDNTTAITAAALVAGQKDVTMKERTLTADKWNVMVLPFTISTYDFCKAIDEYAVFNTLKSAAGADVKFGLELSELKANEPFLVKPASAVNGDVTFAGVTVVDATPTKVVGDAQFIGTYKTITIAAPAEGYSNWAMQGGKFNNIGSATPNLDALRAYLLLNTTSNARIFVEEIDGSTTAIAGINADGELVPAQGWYTVNGVKLEGVPTQKGIYINNGKKIVVK